MSQPRTDTIPVIWLIAARDQLENAFAQAGELREKSQEEQSQFIKQRIDKLDILLRDTFEQAETITVLERLGGHSFRQSRHVLRVEVKLGPKHGGGRTEAHIVKIDRCVQLCKELIGRQTCQRPANERGRTLLGVRLGQCPEGCEHPKFPCDDASDDAPGTLVYQDAYHTLRAGRVVSLEKAFLNCVRWGTPSPPSILAVLEQVFHELHNLCYERAPSLLPREPGLFDDLERRLEKGRNRWRDASSIPGERRVQARSLFPKDCLPFVDLLDFHSRAFRQPSFQPELRFGRAHGDLHGRNIVVGLVNGEARWPAVFDFEDMAVSNYVAWDFVKLETELKIRALQILFPGAPSQFVPKAYDFELKLNEETEDLDRRSFQSWEDGDISNWCSRRSRLNALLLGLRRRAKRYLEVQGPARVHRWLHEYYFFLACYGVYAGRFENYSPNDCLAAYLGASCAATRYVWGVEQVHLSPSDGRALAQQRIDMMRLRQESLRPLARDESDPPADTSASESSAAEKNPQLRWDVRLEKLKTLARSRSEEHIRYAVDGLSRLRDAIPSAPEIVQELAFALLELGEVTGNEQFLSRAIEELKDFEDRQQGLYSRDTELLCRWGRLWKDCGHRASDRAVENLETSELPASGTDTGAPSETTATEGTPRRLQPADWYRMSASYYRRAYEASKDYYPGINLATLEFLISALDRSVEERITEERYRQLAAKIMESLRTDAKLRERKEEGQQPPEAGHEVDDASPEPEDAHWRLASLGEACLLLCEDNAVRHYGAAWVHQNTDAHTRDTIRKQAERIMRHQTGDKADRIHADLRKLFGGMSGGDTDGACTPTGD